MDRLSEIRARCEAFEDSNDSYKGVRPQYILPVLADDGYPHSWAEIAAHSHEDISYLLSRLEKAEAERDKAIKAITPCCLNCKHYAHDGFGDYDCKRKYAPSETSRCANWAWKGE